MMPAQEVLSPQEIQQYKGLGYTDSEIQGAVNEAENEVSKETTSPMQQSYAQAQQMQMNDPRRSASQSTFTGQYNENLIQWQLELDSILERVEHMLKGDKVTFEQGHMIWKKSSSTKDRILNDFGVAEIMRVLSLYLNRNTILSNYKEEVINAKMFDLGNELADLFYLKYENMGLDDLEKRKLYPILVRELVDVVHSAYLRALHGGERESLRESRTVTQQEALNPMAMGMQPQQPKSRSSLNPMRWIKGKYT